MVQYSFQEQAEMVFVYGQADGNGREAARMYRATYPDRQHHPHHTTFGAIFRRLCEHGSFETDERAGRSQNGSKSCVMWVVLSVRVRDLVHPCCLSTVSTCLATHRHHLDFFLE
ncbi:hypothetical protein ANN_13699 [Periplaneta americana]|uniref:DUF4817 domain-containing protein n=1 Tax=Periplaneta americana TaxID=6978 RepID=A0ABQ8SVK9_PERAM|nr:hypothetical protein ANN_13699 [Periplaneta americana]